MTKPSGFAVTVVEEPGVRIDLGIGAFGEDPSNCFDFEPVDEFGAMGVLNAVVGPQDLLQAVEVDHLARRLFVLGGEAAVVGWVPVLRGNHEVELLDELIRDRNDSVTVGHR